MLIWYELRARWRQARENATRHLPDPAELAGDAAEQEVIAALTAQAKQRGWRVFHAVRVPRPSGRGRLEIDAVVVGHRGALVIEIKRWAGEVELAARDGALIQRRPSGETIQHGQVLEKLASRCEALARHHKGASPPLRPVLLFHPRPKLAPRLAAREEVLALADLPAALPLPKQAPARGLRALLEAGRRVLRALRLLPPEPPPPLPYEAELLAETVAALGTWDTVQLHGGAVWRGDVVGSSDPRLRERGRFEAIEVRASRSVLWATLFTPQARLRCVGREPGGDVSFQLPSAATLRFHRVGQPEPQAVPLGQLTRITFGAATGSARKPGAPQSGARGGRRAP